MSNYKKAAQMKLRFNTEKGMLTVEQLWDCPRAMLKRTITAVQKQIKSTEGIDELSFLEDDSPAVDPVLQLRFDILKDVYITKRDEAKAKTEAEQNKQHNAKIDALIAQKQDEELKEKSIEQLEAMRK